MCADYLRLQGTDQQPEENYTEYQTRQHAWCREFMVLPLEKNLEGCRYTKLLGSMLTTTTIFFKHLGSFRNYKT
jgi:hypothetical protein